MRQVLGRVFVAWAGGFLFNGVIQSLPSSNRPMGLLECFLMLGLIPAASYGIAAAVEYVFEGND
jgi:hypothetical protein